MGQIILTFNILPPTFRSPSSSREVVLRSVYSPHYFFYRDFVVHRFTRREFPWLRKNIGVLLQNLLQLFPLLWVSFISSPLVGSTSTVSTSEQIKTASIFFSFRAWGSPSLWSKGYLRICMIRPCWLKLIVNIFQFK